MIGDDVLELDTYLRMYAMMPSYSPGAPLLDQATACTALGQRFVYKVLARAGTPRRILRLLERLYERDETAVCLVRSQPAYICVTRGIKQGCPASASSGAISFEPLLLALRVALGASPSKVLACGDDTGLALSTAGDPLLRLRLFDVFLHIRCRSR